MQSIIFAGVLISVAFAGWPIIGNYSGASCTFVGTVVAITTAISVFALSAKDFFISPLPGLRAILILSMAGFLNGAALYYYSVKVADQNIPTSVFVATVSICMVIVAPLLYFFTKGSAPSGRQFAGYLLACIAIYLLTPPKIQ